MKKLSHVTKQIGLGFSAFCFIGTTAWAGIPLWSFSPNGSPVVSVSATGTATVSYTITNNSRKARQLALSTKTPNGISQVGPCIIGPKGTANATCTLTLSINGSALPSNTVSGGPVLCQANSNGTPDLNQCYQPSSGDTLSITRTTAPGATTLNAAPLSLALSVNDSSSSYLTGNARLITITNTGANDATGVTIAYPTWPGGTPATTASSTCGPTLAAGATCTITVTPGTDATSNCTTGVAPTPGTITVSAANVATPITANATVLGYGCIYEGGYLFSIDDTTSGGSIGGKVVSTQDQSSGIIWSSNGIGSYSFDIIPGIDENSTTGTGSPTYSGFLSMFNGGTYSNSPPSPALAFSTCAGATDGQCNSDNILLFYNTYQTNYDPDDCAGSGNCLLTPGPTSLSNYAAGVCSEYIVDDYNDWYLPAICELDSVNGGTPCTTPPIPQSIAGNLTALLIGTGGTPCSAGTSCLAGDYWSSTEVSFIPQNYAWNEFFGVGGSSPGYDLKNGQGGVRCVRGF